MVPRSSAWPSIRIGAPGFWVSQPIWALSVMSTLAVTTILHLVVGLVVAAVMLDDSPTSSKVGLNVIAGIFAAMAVAVGRAIHGKRIVSPWLLLAVVPTAVGLWLTFG